MKQILKLKYILLKEGEFLYDENTMNYYTFIAPHKCLGKIVLK